MEAQKMMAKLKKITTEETIFELSLDGILISDCVLNQNSGVPGLCILGYAASGDHFIVLVKENQIVEILGKLRF